MEKKVFHFAAASECIQLRGTEIEHSPPPLISLSQNEYAVGQSKSYAVMFYLRVHLFGFDWNLYGYSLFLV